MSYKPSLKDLDDESAQTSGYMPSLDDLPKEEPSFIDKLKPYLSNLQHPGINMATGMMSLAFPGQEGEMVQNLPQVARGTQPTMAEYTEQEIGKFLPGFEIGGYPVVKGAQGLNALRAKNIAKSIVETEKSMKGKYSDLYNGLFKEAKEKGFGNFEVEKPQIDIDTRRKYSSKKDIDAVEDFLQDPTLNNAHLAKSDLIKLEKKLEGLSTKRSAERKQAKAVSDAIENIQSNMFKTKEGIQDKDLIRKYTDIQKGYKNEVLPYSQNKNIQKYKSGKLVPGSLVKKLGSEDSEFLAQRGEHHPEFKRREFFKKMAIALGLGGGAVTGGKTLYDFFSK